MISYEELKTSVFVIAECNYSSVAQSKRYFSHCSLGIDESFFTRSVANIAVNKIDI